MVSRILTCAAAALAAAALIPSAPAGAVPAPSAPPAAVAAAGCPNPDALGTSRVIAVGGAPAVGLKTYPRTLDLADHEVVLTFDDGPWPGTTPRVLDALKAQCVRATFFLIGRNAAASPALARREAAEGHTVGHHTFDHPALTLRALDEPAALADIDRGMAADDRAAYGDAAGGAPRVPFFRFPGFGDTEPLLEALKARRVAVFGADLWASDWIPMTPEAEFERLMARLRAAGRGIILLHDTKRQTADMLPRFLAALKAERFRVVAIVPGEGPTPLRQAPAGWTSETERALAHLWPKARPPVVPVRASAAGGAPPARPSASVPPEDEPPPLRGPAD